MTGAGYRGLLVRAGNGNRDIMTKTSIKLLALAGVAATGFGASAAQAATASATVNARILRQITVTKTSDLDFATIVSSPTASTVVVAPITSTRVCGPGLVCTGTATAANFTVDGTLGQIATVSIPAAVTLTSGANSMSASLLSSTTAPFTIAVTNTFSVGGTLSVGVSQPDGTYTGTFTATVDYQ